MTNNIHKMKILKEKKNEGKKGRKEEGREEMMISDWFGNTDFRVSGSECLALKSVF